MSHQYDYAYFQKSADYLSARVGLNPEIGIILGSALGPFAERIETPVSVDYADIPNFLVSTVASHAGKLIFGTVAGKRVVCMSGRFHSYEGYDFEQLTAPIRLFRLLGVRACIVTNAAGAVNTDYRPGDIMVIRDHIKFNGASPLRGKNVDEFGPRFFDTTKMYTPALRHLALECAKTSPLTVHEGVYFFMPGPQFETPAEIRAIRALGGDAVGMSTVPEAITANHCGMRILGLTLLTCMAAGVAGIPMDTDEVIRIAEEGAGRFEAMMTEFVRRI